MFFGILRLILSANIANFCQRHALNRTTSSQHPYRFVDLFGKWQKCEISKGYNAKPGSEPSKNVDFCIDLSFNFHIFSNPPSRGHFWRVQAPIQARKFGLWKHFGSKHSGTFVLKVCMQPWARRLPVSLVFAPGRRLQPPSFTEHKIINAFIDKIKKDLKNQN